MDVGLVVYVVLHHEDDTDPPIPCNKVQVYKTGNHVHNMCTEAGYYSKVKVHLTEYVITCLHKLCMLEELLAVNSWPPDFIPPASDLYER